MIDVRDWQANRFGAGRRTLAAALLAGMVTATTAPGAPGIGAVTSSGVSMIVNYTAPASNGGLTIKKYTATNNSGTSSASASSTAVRYVQQTSQK